MILAQKQTLRSMEENREPRNEPTLIWAINLRQRRQDNGEKTVSSIIFCENWIAHAKESEWTTLPLYAQK